jgi:hypothetical protein
LTRAVGEQGEPRADLTDAFVKQTVWLIAAAGGKEQLVSRCGGLVSVRTLDNWTAGNYPRTKVTGAVRELDAWARREMPGYPDAAGVPGLPQSCGRYRDTSGAATADVGAPGTDEPTEGPSRPRGRVRRWLLTAAALIVIVTVTAVVTIAVDRHEDDAAGASARGSAGASASSDADKVAERVANLPLPSTGDGTTYTEQAGSIGANTFADPRTLSGGGPEIPPHADVQVRCRYYAPSVPSVSPDGFWYLIESKDWNGLWTPANSFMNGDVPGGPYIHNTDFAVPVCH